MPKKSYNKLIQQIEVVCKRFLWTGGNEITRKALVSRNKICYPKSIGGFNVIDIYIWNKASICKHFWDLYKKKDRLWIKWIHNYYVKINHLWEVKHWNASWMVIKMFKANETVKTAGYTYEVKKFYHRLWGDFHKISWRRLVCNNPGCN